MAAEKSVDARNARSHRLCCNGTLGEREGVVAPTGSTFAVVTVTPLSLEPDWNRPLEDGTVGGDVSRVEGGAQLSLDSSVPLQEGVRG